MNWNLVGSIYGRSSIKLLILSRSIDKHGCRRQFLFLIGRFLAHLTRSYWRPSVRKHFNLLENHWSKWDRTWHECSFACSNQVLLLSLRSVIQHGCQGHIDASDWLKYLMIFFSDTTWRMELKIIMNDHCKLPTKCCYFLGRLKIQDGRQRGT